MFPTPRRTLLLATLTAAALAGPAAAAHADTFITGGPAEDSTTADPTPTFTFSSSTVGAGFECSVNGSSYAACTSPVTLASQADGHARTFGVRATVNGIADPTPAVRGFSVDTQAPTIAFVNSLTENARTKDATPTLKWSVDDLSATARQCAFDKAKFGPCSMPFTPQVALADGPHQLTVKATDVVDHVTTATRHFVVDTTAPVAQVTQMEAPLDHTRTFTFEAPADGGPGYAYFCRLDGGAEKPCASGFFATGALAHGTHTFEVRAVDGLGNAQAGWTAYPFTVAAPGAPQPPAPGTPVTPAPSGTPGTPSTPAAVLPAGAAASPTTATAAAPSEVAPAAAKKKAVKKSTCAKKKRTQKAKKSAARTCTKRKAAKTKERAAKKRG